MYDRQTNIISIMAAFALGGMLGAGIALLMAPQSGQKTRKLIMDKSLEIKDKAMSTAEDTRDRAGKAIDDVAKTTRKRASSISKRNPFNNRKNPIKGRIQSVICE